MKELNEMELKDIDGGSLFWRLGPTNWFIIKFCEFIAGFEEGWKESKR